MSKKQRQDAIPSYSTGCDSASFILIFYEEPWTADKKAVSHSNLNFCVSI